MQLRLYNTLTRKKEIFNPIKKGEVSLYSCGPTVYWYQHIGNLKAYIFSDILKRILKYNGYKVKHIINITDVGHLTSDADTGEDKMIKGIKREGLALTKQSIFKLSNIYTKQFKDDLKKLNVIPPERWTKATDHIKDQIKLIELIEKNGYSYIGKETGNVYFDVSKFKDYGKLAKLKLKKLKPGARIEIDPDKKNPRDFILWFTIKGSKFKGHILKWKSPWGEGWPGWHIECSAMSMKYLGDHFDIHTGGEDHIPIHHTNEIAQSESATGKKFVNYWMHESFLTSKGEKISKSKGNLYTLTELEKIGFSGLDYRYFNLATHYRKPLNFSMKNLESAKNSYKRLKNIISEIKDDGKINKEYIKKFREIINDDLNISKSLQVLWNLLRDKKAHGKFKAIKEMDEIFGLNLLKKEKIEIPRNVKKLAEERQKARKEKNWKKSDELRKKINELGYIIEDNEKSYILKKNNEQK